jgi:hypothetical protein
MRGDNVVDGAGADMGRHSSLIDLGGKPAIAAYYNATPMQT